MITATVIQLFGLFFFNVFYFTNFDFGRELTFAVIMINT